MGEHARLSFSASDRWLRCPASVNMTKGLHEGVESEAAKEGTIAHNWLLDKSLNNWLVTGDTKIICDDKEMAEHLQKCMDYVIQRYEEMPGKNKRIQIETRVDLHYMSNRDDLWGTSDVIISSDMYIDVIDLKYGKGIFVPADTTQNRLYVLGKMAAHMKATKGDVPWVYARSTIMQPRYPDSDGEIFRYVEFEPQELLDWFEKEVLPIAEMTDGDSEPVAGEKQCQWCLAKHTCPAVEAKIKAMMPFEPVDMGKDLPLDEQPENLDVDKLIEIHDSIPFIQGYLKAVSAELRKLLEARDSRLQGKLKLVTSRQTNKWDSDDETILLELTKGKGRIPKKELVKESLISAPQALKLSKLKPEQKARLQEHIEKSAGSLTIVPDSDPRANAFPPITFEDQTKVASEQPSDEGYDFL